MMEYYFIFRNYTRDMYYHVVREGEDVDYNADRGGSGGGVLSLCAVAPDPTNNRDNKYPSCIVTK